jgi:hypothetical protein
VTLPVAELRPCTTDRLSPCAPASFRLLVRHGSSGPVTKTILLYDEITAGAAKRFIAELSRLPATADVTVMLNSPGGNVNAGEEIFAAIERHKGRTTVAVTGTVRAKDLEVAVIGRQPSVEDLRHVDRPLVHEQPPRRLFTSMTSVAFDPAPARHPASVESCEVDVVTASELRLPRNRGRSGPPRRIHRPPTGRSAPWRHRATPRAYGRSGRVRCRARA